MFTLKIHGEVLVFFFFFYLFPSGNHPVIGRAFNNTMGKKLLADGYCDLAIFLRRTMTRTELRQKLQKMDSPVVPLYLGPAPKNAEDMEKKLRSFLQDLGEGYSPNDFESFCLIDFIFKGHTNVANRRQYIREIVEQNNKEKEYDGPLGFSNSIVFFSEMVTPHLFGSISQLNEALKSIEAQSELEGSRIFFRGHSHINYQLIPSILRTDQWLRNERKMYFELIINCSNSFREIPSYLDRLVLMQHYGLPTRLLDITQNPLVALYFACEGEARLGEVVMISVPETEIKYSQSDTVTILSSLPLCSYEEQVALYEQSKKHLDDATEFNKTKQAQKLVHEIRSEKFAFDPIIDPRDLHKNVIVMPEKSNDRIVKQDGAFILCGLSEQITGGFEERKVTGGDNLLQESSLEKLRMRDTSGKKQLLICTDKPTLLEELNRFAINKAKLFPEVDDVADYIKTHVGNI